VTDALKRSLKTFGNVLGNCLYDKEYIKKIQRVKVGTLQPFDPSQLHRHESVCKEEFALSELPQSHMNTSNNMNTSYNRTQSNNNNNLKTSKSFQETRHNHSTNNQLSYNHSTTVHNQQPTMLATTTQVNKPPAFQTTLHSDKRPVSHHSDYSFEGKFFF
jgi:DNA repair and recombination protein RAD52